MDTNLFHIKQWSATRMLAVGFALIILIGAFLLCTPISNRSGEWIPFDNALFTATSATCVTGLIVFDTWTQFNIFGQAVILLLIQVGGLGFMTVALMFSLAVGKRIGLRERSLLAESASTAQLGGVVRLLRRTVIGTAIFEIIGAVLLSIRFIPQYGLLKGVWFSVFHSVSAFCNAGFDLMGVNSPYSSLVAYYADPIVILTIAGLIIVGGIGFMVWSDLIESRFNFFKLRFHTRAVIFTTSALLIGGTIAFLLLENNGLFASMTPGERVLSAFFQAVTPRTAGFNSVDIAALSDGSLFVTMLLMFIGAAPGGTGGGLKVTTLLVLLASVFASLRNKEDASVWHYRINDETTRRAHTGLAIYLLMTVIGVFILCAQGLPLDDSAFECLSAIGTVGLTTGITRMMTTLSKIALILLMYAGRVGSLTVFLAVTNSSSPKLKNPIGKIIVG